MYLKYYLLLLKMLSNKVIVELKLPILWEWWKSWYLDPVLKGNE